MHRNMLFRTVLLSSAFTAASVLFAGSASALEYPIGEPQEAGGMEVAAVYLQPIAMEPPGMMRAAEDSDVHLEADIHAARDNENGFATGDWMPYLVISYTLTKDGATVSSGPLMPMVASDGPHYGDNVKLDGPGEYHLVFAIAPPDGMAFGRHVDEETGVAPWFAPFETTYDFVYTGVGKKGGY
ncbi:iron transporter [Martelella sp. HB161492]|uniref:iron transporter n=1 Tax=Martelella sp. HB161492 TaxID=2720726 RepID=UPI001FEE035A|nr:iron transporter [Martelella sp. HB161492]